MTLLNPITLLLATWTFLAETFEGLLNLTFRRPSPKFRPLPDTIERTYIDSPGGGLEFLISTPQRADDKSLPVLFQHGGFGHASVWLEWMLYLQQHYGGRTYAASVRGHGASYVPSSWFRTVWLTKHDDIAGDVRLAIEEVKRREGGREPIVVGHSAGGEMLQYLLAKKMVTHMPALGLIGAVPHFGSAVVFENWLKVDSMMWVRGLVFMLNHPKSTLSTPELMRRVFFGPDFVDQERMKEFWKWSADVECLQWPMMSLGKQRNGRPEWLEVRDIVKGLKTQRRSIEQVFVLVGSEDAIMMGTSERMVAEYTAALQQRAKEEGGKASRVRFAEIERAGHHVQNDVQWEEAAEALLDWLRQVSN